MRAINRQREFFEQQRRPHTVIRGLWPGLHFENNVPYFRKVLEFFLRIIFIKMRGQRNALEIKLEETELVFNNLPKSFDNTRILLLTDLHLDGIETLADKVIGIVNNVDYDYCILGGDYSFEHEADTAVCSKIKELAIQLCKKSRVFGVLGNHDKYEIAQLLNDHGVEMLMNESVCIEKGSDRIYLTGLDDDHYYNAADLELANSDTADKTFKMIVCHSPELYEQASRAGYSLYLAGHTHGGQICLPGGVAVVTNVSAPRKMVKGRWTYNAMTGYTSRGIGTSEVTARYFCPPEITIITLKNA